jgi:hypothetical protein
LADILDLDFGAVQNEEVNKRNRQYILEQQSAPAADLKASAFSTTTASAAEAACKSYSTREPLRPSFDNSRQSAYCENYIPASAAASILIAPQSEGQQPSGGVPMSSNSSTASSSESRRPPTASTTASRRTSNHSEVVTAKNYATIGTGSPQAAAASTASSSSVLCDTKIEIAGKLFPQWVLGGKVVIFLKM